MNWWDWQGFSIKTKVALVLLSTNLLAILATGLLYYSRHQSQLVETIEKHFHSVARQESQLVTHFLEKHRTNIRLLASQLQLHQAASMDVSNTLSPNNKLVMQQIELFESAIKEVENVAILNDDAEVVLTTNRFADAFAIKPGKLEEIKSRQQPVVMDLRFDNQGKATLLLFVYLENGFEGPAILATETSLADLADLVEQHIGLGHTEETMLLYSDNNGRLLPIVPLKFQLDSQVILGVTASQEYHLSQHINRYTDYRGQDVFALSKKLPNTNWTLVFKIDTDEALSIVAQQRQFLVLSLLVAAVLILIVAITFSRSLTRPLSDLTQVAMMIASGDLMKRIRWTAKDELGVLAQSFNTMADKLIRSNNSLDLRVKEKTRELAIANERLAKVNRDLERVTLEDSLTRVANRRAFDRAYFREWKRSSRTNVPLSLLIVDVDLFKRYNDALGHHAGDDCLVHVASVLSRMCQRDNDLLARYGGEEFVLLLPGVALRDCENVAAKIINAFAIEQLPHPDSPIEAFVTVSVGYGTHEPSSKESPSRFFEMVDASLYQAKANGRNQAFSSQLKTQSSMALIKN